MSITAKTPHPGRSVSSVSNVASKTGRSFTRFVRTSVKPVIFKLSRKLSVTYWPGRRRAISGMLIALLTQFVPGFAPGLAHAAPLGAQVMAGGASVSQASKLTTNITQTTQNAVINWQSFSIGAKEAVNIVQPGASSVLLNRVIGSDPSCIFGSLSANGQVFLVNNAGVYFAPGASVNVGGLVASSMDVTNTNFLAGKYQFDAGTSAAAVINDGHLSGRYVVLSAPQVTNAGSIEAPSGAIALAAGGRVNLAIAGGNLVSVSVDAATANAAVANSGNLRADGGKVFLTAHSSNAVFDTVINTSGIVRATSLVNRNGAIVIDGGAAGVVQVGGALVAAGVDGGSTGGTVKVLGEKVYLLAGASVDVSGDAGGGTALIGGNFHGVGLETNAVQVRVDKGAVIDADAINSGNGGNVAVWADGHTRFAGSISARGGALGGDGGFVETSGKGTLDFMGSVNTSAAKGKTGTLLLDPTDITITDSDSATMVNNGYVFSNTGTAPLSNLSASKLEAALANSSVTVDTASSGSGAGAITVAAPVSWGANQLTLKAGTNININANLNASGNASLALQYGQGAVAAGNLSTYNVNAQVNLPAGNHFSTLLGSDGSVKNYIVITSLGAQGSTSATDLQGMNGNLSGHYALGADINALPTAGWSSGFIPIGSINSGFTGNFDGLNHTINNLHINRPSTDGVGLFGLIGASQTGTTIRNVGLVGGSVIGRSYVGALLGESDNSNVTVANSYAAGSVSGVNYVGGLVGVSSGPVSNSYATSSVSGNYDVGGLVGYSSGPVSNSYAAGSVNGTSSVGGLMGYNAGMINNSYATGSASGNGGVGALVGANSGSITSSHWNSDVRSIGIGISTGDGTQTTTSGLSTAAMHSTSSFNDWSISNTTGNGVVWRMYEGHTAPLLAGFLTGLTLDNTSVIYNGGSQSGIGTGYGDVYSASGKNVGSYAAYSNQQGYDITGGNLTIVKAALNMNAVTDTRTYNGAMNSAGVVTFTGLVGGDTVAGASQSFGDRNVLGVDKSTLSVNAGYTVNDGNLGANYSVSKQSALGTINPAALGIHAVTDTRTYTGNTNSAGAVTFTGLVGGDTVAGASQSFDSKNVLGVDKSTLSVNAGYAVNDGNLGGNYSVSKRTALGTINPAALGIHAVTDTRTYTGDTNSAGAVTFTGLVGGDTVAGASQSFGSKNVLGVDKSTLSVNAGYAVNDGNLGGNYIVSKNTALGTITKAALAIDATADSKIYSGDTNSAATVSITGLVGGDTVSGLSQSFGSKNVLGMDASTLAVNSGFVVNDGNNNGGNYTVSSQTAMGTITRLDSVTWVGNSTGNWSQASNWAGNAIPDLANVKQVIIPVGTSVMFDANVGTTGIVQLDSINSLGALAISSGKLTVAGTLATGSYTQTGGAVAAGNLTASNYFHQTDGSLAVNGNVSINQGSGAVVLGDASMATLTVTANGDILQSAATGLTVSGTTTLTALAKNINLTNVGNDFGGNVSVTGGTTSLTTEHGLSLSGSVTGNLTANASGAVTQSASLSVGGSTNIHAGSHSVTLDNAGNALTGAVTLASGTTTLTSTLGLTLDGSVTGDLMTHSAGLMFGATSVIGSLNATANGAVSQSAAVNVTGSSIINAHNNAVTLANPANNFGSALSVTGAATRIVNADTLLVHVKSTGGASVSTGINDLIIDGSVTGDLSTHSAALNFGATTVAGNLTAAASGAVSQSGALSVTGSSGIVAANQGVMLINPGNDFGGALSLTSAAAQIVDMHGLTIGGNIGGDLNTHSAALNFGATVVGGNLTAAAGGAVSQSGALLVAGSTGIAAAGQAVTLNNAANDFGGAVTIAGSATQIVDKNALIAHLDTTATTSLTATNGLTVDGATQGDLSTNSAALMFGAAYITGNLNATATGAVTQNGMLTVTGTSNIVAPGQSVMLNNPGNLLTGALTVKGAATQIVDTAALTAHLNTTGATSIVSASGLTLDGSVTGNLGTQSAALNFDATTVGGNLTVAASGAVSQTGALLVAGNTGIAATGQTVTLGSAGNDFGGALSLTSASAQIVDQNTLIAHLTTTGATRLTAVKGLTLDGSIAGNLTATAGGALSQNGALLVTGSTGITALGNSVTLNNAGNDFGGALNITSASGQIVDMNALTIGGSVTGDLTLHAGALTFATTAVGGNLLATASGAVGQTGTLQVAGSTGITAAGQSVLLNNAGNDFGGAVTVAGAATQIVDTNALIAHLITTGATSVTAANGLTVDGSVGGDLTATAGGAVSQSGALLVAGSTSIAAAGQAVTLNNAGNDFGGAVTIAGSTTQIVDKNALTAHLLNTGATSLMAVNGLTVDGSTGGDLSTNAAALTFGATHITGNLNATATGAVGQTDALTVLGSAAIAASGQTATLTNASNVFAGPLTVTSAAAKIVDMAALTAHVNTTGATSLRSGDVLLFDGSVAGDLSTSSKALTLGATTIAGKFNATATGAVNQTGVLNVGGGTVIDATAQAVTLNNPGNDFGSALTLTSAAAHIVDASALTAHLHTTGPTSLTSACCIHVDGSVAGDLTTQSAALNFGATTVTGNLLTIASGAVSQSGMLSVAGTSNIVAAGQSVTLNNPGNVLTGAVTVAGAATQIVDMAALTAHLTTTGVTSVTSAQGLTLDGNVKGNLTAAAGGAVSQSGALLVTGSTDIAAAGQSVTLDNGGNDFGGALNVTSAVAKIVDMNALTIGGSVAGDLTLAAAALTFAPTTVGGNLTATASGAVGQTGALLVAGSTGITAAGQSVMLNNAGNDFNGAVTVAGATTQIVDTNALIAHLATTGAASLTAANGLTVDGSAGGDLSTHSAALSFGTTSIGGNLTVAAGGAVSQSGALRVAGSTGIAAAGQAVTLGNTANDFGGALTIAGAATQIADKNALIAHVTTTGTSSITAANGLTLDGSIGADLSTKSAALTFGTTLVTGNLTAAATGAVNQTGALTVLGSAGILASGQSVTLTNAGNTFDGPLTVTSAAAQIVDMDALTVHLITTGATSISSGATLLLDGSVTGDLTTLSSALALGATTIGGQFNATATGAVSQTGALNVGGSTGIAAAGQAVTLSNPGNHFGGALTVAGAATRIADTAALTAHLNTTGATSIAAAKDLMVDGSIAGNLSTTSAALSFGATTVSGNLTAAATTGAVSQSGALTVAGSSGIAAAGQAVTLTNPGNDFGGTLTLAGAAVQIVDTNALMAHLATTGPTSLTATNGLTLDGSAGGDVTIISAALSFGTTAIAGNLNAAAAGAISQTGALTVAGTTGIAAAGQAVTLTNTGNDFGGAVTLAGAALQLADQNALTAHVTSTGATSLVAVNGLTVDGSAAGDLNTRSAALSFGLTSVVGNLNAAAAGAISQTGALTVAGTTGIAAAGQTVTLSNVGNDFGGALTVAAAATQIVDQNALIAHLTTTGTSSLTAVKGLTVDGSIAGNLTTQSAALDVGPTTVAGNLTAAATGAVSQSGALSVTGSTSIAAAGQTVTLTNAGNDFDGALTLTSAAAQIVDTSALTVGGNIAGDLMLHAAALTFAPTTVAGNLTATASGAVGQTGALLVAGTTGIAAAGQSVMLTNAGNDFGGALTVAGAATQIVDINALVAHVATTGATSLSASNGLTVDGSASGDLSTRSAAVTFGTTLVGGNLAGSATGAVSQSGALSVTGSTGIAAAGQAVTLTNAGNDFGGVLSVASAATQIADRNALTAHVATTGTTSITTANGLTLDGSIQGDLNTHSAALSFGATRVGGNLTATATGAVGQSGVLAVAGSTGIDAAGQNVMLNNTGNALGGAVTLTSAAAQIVDTNALTIGGNVAGDLTIRSAALTFGKTAVAGNLAATASGAVGQTGALMVAGSTGITAANQAVTLDRADNHFVGTVSASGGAVSLADNNVLTLGKITATQANLSAQTTLQMASGGMVDAKDIALALGLAGTPLGSLGNPINVQALANVTFGATTPAVTAYFTSVPTMFFKFNNPLAEAAYGSGNPLIYVNNVIYNNQAILSVNSTLYGSISRVLQAIQKKADGYAEAIDRGLQSNLAEYAAYPHTGSLKLQAPICAGVLRVKGDSSDAAQARACTALIMVR